MWNIRCNVYYLHLIFTAFGLTGIIFLQSKTLISVFLGISRVHTTLFFFFITCLLWLIGTEAVDCPKLSYLCTTIFFFRSLTLLLMDINYTCLHIEGLQELLPSKIWRENYSFTYVDRHHLQDNFNCLTFYFKSGSEGIYDLCKRFKCDFHICLCRYFFKSIFSLLKTLQILPLSWRKCVKVSSTFLLTGLLFLFLL